MRPSTVVIAVELVSVEYGVWCEACSLSSGVRVHYSSTINGRTALNSRLICTEEP